MIPSAPARERIIIFAPEGPNLKVVRDVLTKAELACCACDGADEFCRLLDEGAGVGIIFSENLTRENAACIRDFLKGQPPWSDLPIIFFTRDLSMQIPYLETLGSHRNIITIEMPIHTSALLGLLKSLLQARQRQYESRDLIHELEETKRELLKFKTDLENKNKELESIIGVVSHDMRSPLVNVKGFVNEIKKDSVLVKETLSKQEGCLSKETKRVLETFFEQALPESIGFIESSATAMSQLVESLVQVVTAGLVQTKPELLDMNSLMKEIIANLEFRIMEKHAEVIIEELPESYSDRTQTRQILSNLVDNAIKYLDPNRKGKIRISGVTRDKESIFIVADNGLGIPKDKQDKIFDIFFRLHKENAKGEGIGLAIVKRMVDRNNGTISLESEPGKGSKFYISLPNGNYNFDR